MEGVIPSKDADLASLFGSDGGEDGDGSDMESLFGGEDEGLALPSEPTPPPLPLPLSLPDPPLALPAAPVQVPATSTQSNTGHVSTLPEPQGGSSKETWSLPFPPIALDQEEGEPCELAPFLATEKSQGSGRGRGLQRQNKAGRPQQPPPPQQKQAADTPDSNKRSRHGHGRQDDRGRAAIEDGDDDVIFLGSTQAAPRAVAPVVITPAMHYLEMRPRCPSIPPPPRIDQREQDADKLLPFVQLDPKLCQRDIYNMLDINTSTGKSVANECRQHITNPEYTIQSSGSTNAESVRIFKLMLIITSIKFLKDLGMGERWFGSSSTLTPKSRHVWPDDSTTLTLYFVKLLYRIHRSRQSLKTAKDKEAKQLPIVPPPVLKHNSPLVRSRETLTFRLGLPTEYISPQFLRERLLETGAKRTSDALDEPTVSASGPDGSSAEDRPSKRYQADSLAEEFLEKVPDSATIRYFINIVKASEGQVLSQLELNHTGDIREASYSYLLRQCMTLGYSVASISVWMPELKEVQDDESWNRAVCQVYRAMFTNHEVRVLVRLHE